MAGKFAVKLQTFRVCSLPLGGAVAQRLKGFKSAEPKKKRLKDLHAEQA